MKGKSKIVNNYIDISQPLDANIGHWTGDTPFSYELSFSKEQTGSVNIGRISSSLHTGTHVDAPFHFEKNGENIHQLDINVFIGPARLIDVSKFKQIDREVLSRFDLDGVERVLLKTAIPNKPERFPEEIPFLTEEGADLLKEKGIFLVGVDVPSVDPINSKEMSAHKALYRNGIHILENIMVDDIEQGDYELIALPLPIVGADGSPVRAVIRSLNKRQGGKTW
ncbi:arylformamidase [Aquibacillus sp. 3ASR75-11]|uniref:Kynurenine formamidase n=1 Tax=Terrihalobacillus insolitus TaxID=2950438 RepID=A0A9X3WQT1_9BACI|nr:arylformamidase [Terrihalobacillus insolitus]MDC3424085.1 arylformamidase [Terrihalobacillus insolitus]